MLDFFKGIADFFTSIFDFFVGIIEGITGFVASLQNWWNVCLTIIDMLPDSVVVIFLAAFALLVSFIVIELLRDFL